MEWDWQFTIGIIPTLVEGLIVTVEATILGAALALVVGLVFAVVRRASNRVLRHGTGWIVEFVRGTPLLVQLYFLFYVLPDLGILLAPLTAGVIGLGIHYGAYTSEVYRAGLNNVPRSQWEAAKACNLTRPQTWIHVVLPQAIPPMIPALANYVVAMFKETPLLSAITVLELMSQARGIANYHYRYIEPMTMVGVFFLLISIPAVLALRALERRSRQSRPLQQRRPPDAARGLRIPYSSARIMWIHLLSQSVEKQGARARPASWMRLGSHE